MNPESEFHNEYIAVRAAWGFAGTETGWIVIRERCARVNGDSGWTTRSAREFPEILAYRKRGERTWKKGVPPNLQRGNMDYDRTESVPEEEAVAIRLMRK